MRDRLPQALGKTPLADSIFEVRFTPVMPTAGDVLPGLLFSTFGERYPDVVPLPVSTVPRQIRAAKPELMFQAAHRLQSKDGAIQVGDRVVALTSRDYPGWTDQKKALLDLVRALEETKLVKSYDRFSFRYINILQGSDGASPLDLLELELRVMGERPSDRGLQLRFERDEGNFTTILQIAPEVTLQNTLDGGELQGLLVDVDALYRGGPLDVGGLDAELLDEGHRVAKNIFFTLLTDDAIDSMDPRW